MLPVAGRRLGRFSVVARDITGPPASHIVKSNPSCRTLLGTVALFMNHRLYEALQGEIERCKRWYGESELFTALGAWAMDLEMRVRRLEAVPEAIDGSSTTAVTTPLRAIV